MNRKPHRACDNEVRVQIFALMDSGAGYRCAALSLNTSDDYRLKEIVTHCGWLAGTLDHKGTAQRNLIAIVGWCFGWLMALGEHMPFDKIHDERERQQQMFMAGKFLFTCASPIADSKRKLRILVEEIGEVAEAVDKIESRSAASKIPSTNLRKHLREELVQVAAVAVAWLESLEVKA